MESASVAKFLRGGSLKEQAMLRLRSRLHLLENSYSRHFDVSQERGRPQGLSRIGLAGEKQSQQKRNGRHCRAHQKDGLHCG